MFTVYRIHLVCLLIPWSPTGTPSNLLLTGMVLVPILSLVNEETAANAWRSLICLWRETDKHHAGLINDVIIMTNFSSHHANANKRRFILLVAAAIVHIEASLLKLWRATARLLLVFCHSCE